MIELTELQTKTVYQCTPMMHEINRAQLINGIEQALNGTWSTARLKESAAWKRIPEKHKADLSHAVDGWLYKASGGQGVDSPAGIKAFYKGHHETTPIMPSKLII
jgi:hypothetical protein